VGRDAIRTEQERFRLRLKEVERAMSENTISKLEKERDRLVADMRQLTLIDIDRRVQEDRLRDLEAELERRSNHFHELLARLKSEQDRLLSLVLPKRYQLRQSAQVFSGGCRDPHAGERPVIYHTDTLNQFAWWSSLNHGGLLIAPARLATTSPLQRQRFLILDHAPPRCCPGAAERREAGAQAGLFDVVLEGVLQLPALEWKKASAIGAEWSHRLINGESLKPRRLWLGSDAAILPVFDDAVKQIGVGTGRRSTARVIEWLRKSGQKLALLTNGVQWRLIHAGPDYDAWCQWDIGYWFEEGQTSDQVQALLHLLSPQALTPPKEGMSAPLIAAIQTPAKVRLNYLPIWVNALA